VHFFVQCRLLSFLGIILIHCSLTVHATLTYSERMGVSLNIPINLLSIITNKLQPISIVKQTRCTNVSNLFYIGMTLYISDGLSVHHQELKTVRTATGICQTDTAVCLLANRQQYLFDICLLLYVQSLTLDDGRKDRLKHVECHSKIN